MPARSLVIPGAIPAVAGASVALSSIDQQIANLPGLIHCMDPASFAGRNVLARDRRSGAPMFFGMASVNKQADGGSGWNNQPILNFTDTAGYVRLDPLTIPQSYTVMFVASHTAVLNAAGIRTVKFFTTYGTDTNGTGEDAVFQWVKPVTDTEVGMGIEFFSTLEGTTANKNGPITGYNVGANTPRIWAVTFDAETLTSKLFNHANVTLPLSTKVHAKAGKANAGDFWTIGGSPYQSSGLQGSMGMFLIFDRDMSKPANGATGYFAQARSLLAQKYNIS
ncbi:hypothetical protein LCM17_21090 [Cereibacter sphaeroides]|nr:hypothetical protein [Cereibacter sphaeroides]